MGWVQGRPPSCAPPSSPPPWTPCRGSCTTLVRCTAPGWCRHRTSCWTPWRRALTCLTARTWRRYERQLWGTRSGRSYTESHRVAKRVTCSCTALTIQQQVLVRHARRPRLRTLVYLVPFHVPQVTAGGYALSFPLQPPQEGQQQQGVSAGSAPDIAVGTDDTKLNLWSMSYRYGSRYCVRQQQHRRPAPRPIMCSLGAGRLPICCVPFALTAHVPQGSLRCMCFANPLH